MTKITSIIPTGNEQNKIIDAIKSVRFSDEVMVVDSLSTDDTLKFADIFNKSEYPSKEIST